MLRQRSAQLGTCGCVAFAVGSFRSGKLYTDMFPNTLCWQSALLCAMVFYEIVDRGVHVCLIHNDTSTTHNHKNNYKDAITDTATKTQSQTHPQHTTTTHNHSTQPQPQNHKHKHTTTDTHLSFCVLIRMPLATRQPKEPDLNNQVRRPERL